MFSRVLRLLWQVTLILGLSLPAQAHRKSDVITLYNGDRITGEIQQLLGGRLSLGTDAMGTIKIEWKEIASLSSNYNYEVRLVTGERFFGSLAEAAVAGSIRLKDVFGERDLSWEDVVELRPIEDSIADRLDVYLSANYAFTKASGVTQTELRANVSYEDERAQNAITSRLTVSDTDQETRRSSRVTVSRKVWTDRKAIYRNLFGGHETNDELGLDYRITLGAGLGRYILDTNYQTLTVGLGIQGLEERSLMGDRQESAEAVITGHYSRWRFDSPELNLILGTDVYPSLSQSGRVRADTNATLRWEFISDFFWDISAWSSYDSSAVDDEAGEFDWGITTGLGWDF
ncbi:MAG: DUF481 domain-containing protein [Pseudomonadota bacterium]